MTKRTKSELEDKPVGKKTKNNNVNNNIQSCFCFAYINEDNEFVSSCKSNTLKDDDKRALKKVKNINLRGQKLVFKIIKKSLFYGY